MKYCGNVKKWSIGNERESSIKQKSKHDISFQAVKRDWKVRDECYKCD